MIGGIWLLLAVQSYNNDIISGVLLYPEYTVRKTQVSCVLLHGERGEKSLKLRIFQKIGYCV